jgi:N-acetylneuraminic acid mutarotase
MKKLLVAALLFVLTAACLTNNGYVLAISTENSWATKTPLPQAVPSGEAAVVGGKLYVMAGSSNYEYDPATDKWTTKTSMPTPRSFFGIAAYGNKIYCIGGLSRNGDITGVNEVYDPASDTWQTKHPMPTGRSVLTANVVGGNIYLISGYVGDTTVSLNEVYNVASDSWSTKVPILYPVVNCASAVCGYKIYIFGGQDQYLGNNMNVAFTQIYDTESNSWSLGAPMPTTVLGAGAGATTGQVAPIRIYLFGGYSGADINAVNITQIYNPENNTWCYGTPMPTAREALAVAVINDTLYAIGGSSGVLLPFLTSNEQYTPLDYGTIAQPAGLSVTITVALIVAVALPIAIVTIVAIVLRKQGQKKLTMYCDS